MNKFLVLLPIALVLAACNEQDWSNFKFKRVSDVPAISAAKLPIDSDAEAVNYVLTTGGVGDQITEVHEQFVKRYKASNPHYIDRIMWYGSVTHPSAGVYHVRIYGLGFKPPYECNFTFGKNGFGNQEDRNNGCAY